MSRFRAAAAAAAVVLCSTSAIAQVRDSIRCNSIIAAARVDSQAVAIFVTAGRVDGIPMSASQAQLLATAVASSFLPPNPFRLTVFSGPAKMRLLRRLAADTVAELRAPTITGVYRFTSTKAKAVAHVEMVRSSLIPGFDFAAEQAILAASIIKGAVEIPDQRDSMRVEVRFSMDSMTNSRRMSVASFPRMRVVDAVPNSDNPSPLFPVVEKLDSASKGEVVLRFVVAPDGLPSMETIEVVRATAMTFLRSVLTILPAQLFSPATINGCAVAQEVYYPFSFLMPDPVPPRH